MGAAKNILSSTQESGKTVFEDFKQHCLGTRVDTRTTSLNIIRKAYPDYHVTEVDESRVSLIEYAEAGKAIAILDVEGEAFNATRWWRPVGERIEKKLHPGKLDDDFRFARFQYIWEGKEFVVYLVRWKDMLESPNKVFFVVSDGNVIDGHCINTDTLLLSAGKWTSQLHEEIFVFDGGHWDKSKELWRAVQGSSWDDCILDLEMKRNIQEDVQGFFNSHDLYTEFAVPWKRGIIFHGVPGNGKTVSIRAIINSLNSRPDQIPSLYVKSFDTCQGEQYAIRQIFLQARKSAPCLLIFEDLDSLVIDEVRSYFLNEVDGLESNDGILMIGSTNHLDRLDPAIAKRPSRFDRKYHFKLPVEEERSAYAEYWRKKLLKNTTVEFPTVLCDIIAKLTEGFSFAYLKELFVMTLLTIARGAKAEDFEFVEAEDLEAPEGEASANGVSEALCGKIKEQAEKSKLDTEKDESKKSKMVMPAVEIPEHLGSNILLRVIKHQIRILHSEMDNTKEDQWPSSKESMSSPFGSFQDQFTRPMRRRRRRC
ncbi:P-loop containing nucleoside triphosphate hydrolase protein [Zopfia rhizophila CBS 207.26]|uniref:P-loop containing nucleoside triphosphate hydrolase protein n=1 Tax=Zopfia rhizophila CBS 207.26 TaxID=1314779 RepID=A0A6A6DH39_9PEZI|nr:P-loop containing nucleoside triphosphate hydrolase protein [Zopfia rhizophila CBS 207.26]